MDLNVKLKGIPHIYYINLEHEIERKKYMESQFKQWGIVNYTRVNASKFSKLDFDSWNNLIHKPNIIPKDRYRSVAVSLSHIETIREWFENTEEDYVILMEDDTDMSFIEYWHFDWQYLMDNIPYDWDAIQLMFNSSHSICCFLHQKKINTWNGPILVKRSYASKLISLYYINGKYNFIKKINRSDQRFCKNFHSFEGTNNHRYTILDVDEWLGFNGKVYQLPLFSQNPYLDEIPRIHHINSHKIHRFWWTTGKNDYSLEDFFTYGKEYDNKMTFGVVYE
jgi:hypothetical protein